MGNKSKQSKAYIQGMQGVEVYNYLKVQLDNKLDRKFNTEVSRRKDKAESTSGGR